MAIPWSVKELFCTGCRAKTAIVHMTQRKGFYYCEKCIGGQ